MNTNQIQGLLDERARITNEYRALLDRADAEHRDLTVDERSQLDRMDVRLDDLAQQADLAVAERRRTLEAAEARTAYAGILTGSHLARAESRDRDAFTRFLTGETRTLDVDLRSVAREKQLIRSGASGHELRMELRDLVEDVATAGGSTVPTSFARRLYEFLEWYSGARRLNVTVLTTASGENLTIPTVASFGTAALRGEGTALAENDPTFSSVTLNAWKYGQLVQVSSELLADSGVDVLGFLARDCGRAIGRATDLDYITGSGTSKPKGIMTTQLVGATAQTGSTGVPSFANLLDLVYSINPVNRSTGAGWLMRDTTAAAIRKITDTTGRPIWEPSVVVGQPDLLLGYPVIEDPHVPALGTAGGTAIAFGNFEGYYIRDVGTMRFERSDDFAFSSDLVTFRAVHRTDGDVVCGADGSYKFLKMPTS